MLDLIALGESTPPASALPPQARVRVLLIILGVAAITLLGLLALTVIRRILRRSELNQPHSKPKRKSARELSPWEQAGRRAAPVDDGAAPNADRRPGDGEAPRAEQ